MIKAQNEKCLKRSRNLFRRKEKGQEAESESLVPTENVICDHLKVAYITIFYLRGGKVASLLVRWSADRALRVRALVGDIVLCSWARHSHSASLHPGCINGKLNAAGDPEMD